MTEDGSGEDLAFDDAEFLESIAQGLEAVKIRP